MIYLNNFPAVREKSLQNLAVNPHILAVALRFLLLTKINTGDPGSPVS